MPRHRDQVRYAYTIDQGITIATAQGDIDAHNADGLLREMRRRHAAAGRALLLDLTGLSFLSTHGLQTLIALDRQCHRAALPWIAVPSPAVSRLLRIGATQGQIPTAESIPAALSILHNATIPRRTLRVRDRRRG